MLHIILPFEQELHEVISFYKDFSYDTIESQLKIMQSKIKKNEGGPESSVTIENLNFIADVPKNSDAVFTSTILNNSYLMTLTTRMQSHTLIKSYITNFILSR